MVFTRYVQSGRVALINFGEHLNKLIVIVDILDQSRVLVEGPTCGLRRQVIGLRRLALTSITLEKVARGASTADVKKAYVDANVDANFAASSWGIKIARKRKRAALNDFGRFKVIAARMKKSKAVKVQLEKLLSAKV